MQGSAKGGCLRQAALNAGTPVLYTVNNHYSEHNGTLKNSVTISRVCCKGRQYEGKKDRDTKFCFVTTEITITEFAISVQSILQSYCRNFLCIVIF